MYVCMYVCKFMRNLTTEIGTFRSACFEAMFLLKQDFYDT
jgi:hypothetical protein